MAEYAQLKRQVVNIDSRNRDDFELTTPSQYVVKLDAPIKNIKSMKLISTEIPNSQYVINSKNNIIEWEQQPLVPLGTPIIMYQAPIVPGTYTGPALASAMDVAMHQNATDLSTGLPVPPVVPGSIYSISYQTSIQKIRIVKIPIVPGVVSWRYRFNFKTGPNGSDNLNRNPAKIMGFWPGYDTVWTADEPIAPLPGGNWVDTYLAVLLSDEVVILSGENYCFLCIKGYPALRSTAKVGDVFGRIIWSSLPRNVVFNSYVSNYISFPKPISRLDKFEVSFIEPDGSLYQFNNVEHSFSIEMLTANYD
jgi:hypothetical protein